MLRKIEMMHKLFGVNKKNLCKDCEHLIQVTKCSKRLYKCTIYGNTDSEASDWKIHNIACGLAPNNQYNGRNVIELVKRQSKPKRPLEPIPGQMKLFE